MLCDVSQKGPFTSASVSLSWTQEAHPPIAKEAPKDAPALQVRNNEQELGELEWEAAGRVKFLSVWDSSC